MIKAPNHEPMLRKRTIPFRFSFACDSLFYRWRSHSLNDYQHFVRIGILAWQLFCARKYRQWRWRAGNGLDEWSGMQAEKALSMENNQTYKANKIFSMDELNPYNYKSYGKAVCTIHAYRAQVIPQQTNTFQQNEADMCDCRFLWWTFARHLHCCFCWTTSNRLLSHTSPPNKWKMPMLHRKHIVFFLFVICLGLHTTSQ